MQYESREGIKKQLMRFRMEKGSIFFVKNCRQTQAQTEQNFPKQVRVRILLGTHVGYVHIIIFNVRKRNETKRKEKKVSKIVD